MDYTFNFGVVLASWQELARGAFLTVQLSLTAMFFALILGVLGVLGKQWGPKPVRALVSAYIEIIRNTPFLVQVFFIFFGLPTLGIRLSPYEGALIALSLNGGAFAIEIIRGGFQAIKAGQIEAGTALGLSKLQIFRYVIIRPAIRSVYPALSSQFILLMLTSSIASSISARELTNVASYLESKYFVSFEIYFTVALIYLFLSIVLSFLLKGIGRIFFTYPV